MKILSWNVNGIRACASKGLVEWIKKEEGSAGVLENVNWDALDMSKVSQEESDRWEEVIRTFFKKRTKTEIERVAISNKITSLFPCYSCEEIVEDEHLHQREFWIDIDYPHLDTSIKHPGPFCKMSLTPLEIQSAPRIGEHNTEIYRGELGLSEKELLELSQVGAL